MQKMLLALLLVVVAHPALAVVCVVTEHDQLPVDAIGRVMQVPKYPPVAVQAVDFTVSEATADPFSDSTYYIGIRCTAAAYFEVADEGMAAVDSTSFPWVNANEWFFMQVSPGQEIAFYDGSS